MAKRAGGEVETTVEAVRLASALVAVCQSSEDQDGTFRLILSFIEWKRSLIIGQGEDETDDPRQFLPPLSRSFEVGE